MTIKMFDAMAAPVFHPARLVPPALQARSLRETTHKQPERIAVPRRFSSRLGKGFAEEDMAEDPRDIDVSVSPSLLRLADSDALRRTAFLLGLVGLFAIVLFSNLAFSFRQALLATVPRYDDIGYLLDAMRRLTFGAEHGFGAFLAGVVASPPHAPVSTLTAMLGFSLFGPEIPSAYIANGWILALYIGALAYFSRRLETVATRLLFVAIFLFVPVSHAMITEFRPDMAAGLVFSLALVAIVSTDLMAASRGRRIAVAALCVAATIVKPSGAVVVIPGLGIAFLAAVWLQARSGYVPLLEMLRRTALPVIAYGVMLAPFALIWGDQTVAYIYQALVSNSDVWRTDGSRLFHWTYHLFGQGGRIALKPFNWIGLAVIAGDIALLRRHGASRERCAAYGLYLTLAVLYVAMAMSAEKTPFQGSFFYVPFIIAVALASVRLLVAVRTLAPQSRAVGLGLATFALVLLATRPLASGYTAIPRFAAELPPIVAATADRIADFISARRVGPACPDRTPILLSTNPDPLTPESVVFALAARGIALDYRTSYMARSEGAVDQAVENADLVLIPDPAVPELNAWLPGSRYGAATLAALKRDRSWTGRQVGTVEGAPVWLFMRSACAPQTTPF